MLTQQDLQRISDHFSIGKIGKVIYRKNYFELLTNQGGFIVLESEPQAARTTEEERLKKVGSHKNLKRLLLPDYTGELHEDSSYAHYKDKYYSIYRMMEN